MIFYKPADLTVHSCSKITDAGFKKMVESLGQSKMSQMLSLALNFKE